MSRLRYLLDTDVLCKKDGPNGRNIVKWLRTVDDDTLAIGALTIFEISTGVEKTRSSGPSDVAAALEAGLVGIKSAFAGRIIAVDAEVAEEWGRLVGPTPKDWFDRGLVATAKSSGLVLVTCNAKDMKGLGVEVINPERDPPGRWERDGTPIKAPTP